MIWVSDKQISGFLFSERMEIYSRDITGLQKKKKIKPPSWFVAMGISELDHLLGHFCDHQPPADSFDQEVLLPVALPSQPTLSTTLLASGLVGAARKVPFPGMAFFFPPPAWKICWYRFELQMLARPQDSNTGVHHWGGG